MPSTTITTETQVVKDSSHFPDSQQLARIQYVEPETSVDPWDCGYFAVPKAKEVIHTIQPLTDLRPSIFLPSNPYKLSTHAFTGIKHQSKLNFAAGDGYDSELTQTVLIPEIKEILKEVTGAETVHVLGLATRLKESDPDTVPLSERDPKDKPERCGIPLETIQDMDMI